MPDLLVLTPQAELLRGEIEARLPGSVRAHFVTDPTALSPEARRAEIALGVPDALAACLPELSCLRWLQSTWAGVEPLLNAPRRDYLLTNARGMFGAQMSEFVLAWLLALRRKVIERANARQWNKLPDPGLANLRLGIAGLGSIGCEVAQRCAPLVGEVWGLNRDGRETAGCSRCFAAQERLAFARGLDALVLLLPHTPATAGFADRDLLMQLHPGAMVISAGRASALHLPVALDLLDRKRLAALVLDVLPEEPLPENDPLWRRPGVYITSHTAAPTSVTAIAALFLDNLERYLSGRTLLARVDFERGY